MEGESGINGSIIDDLHCLNNERGQSEVEGGVTRTIIDAPHLGISKEIKWKLKVVFLEVSLTNFFLLLSI